MQNPTSHLDLSPVVMSYLGVKKKARCRLAKLAWALVADMWPGRPASSPRYFQVYNKALYFSADDGVHGAIVAHIS